MGRSIRVVGSHLYAILFIQVEPAAEEEICNEFCGYFKDNDPQLYFSFSEFDIIAFLRINDENDLELLRAFSHSKIRDFQRVICYTHHEKSNVFEFDSALSITLFKFDEHEIMKMGIKIEDEVAELVKPVSNNVKKLGGKSLLLSTLGWPEAIFIQSGKNLNTLLNSVADVVSDGYQHGKLQISHTLPCVKRKDANGMKSLSFEHVDGELENWRIALSCIPYTMGHLDQMLRNEKVLANSLGEFLLEIDITFGRRDLLIRPKRGIKEEIRTTDQLLSVLSLITRLLQLKN